MASFIVEDGSGISNANAYITAATADEFVSNYGADATWTAAASADKLDAIRCATQYLDATYQGKWRGLKSSQAQALAWPRYNAIDDDNFIFSSTAIPKPLADACSYLALRCVLGDTLVADLSTPGSIVKESSKIGPIEESIEYSAGRSQQKQYTLVERFLSVITESQDEIFRS